MTTLANIASLSLSDSSRLDNLPVVVLRIILSYLDTAQSVANLGSTCKKLHETTKWHGWRTFVKCHFGTFALPEKVDDDEWLALAKTLTWQSRAWDRRALVMASILPPTPDYEILPDTTNQWHGRGRGRGRGYGRGRGRGRGRGGARGGAHGHGHRSVQTLPPHAIVDARLERKGGSEEEEILAWGLGEDVVVRWRQSRDSLLQGETWRMMEGAPLGLKSGPDDVTAISILKDQSSLLVGRASGRLQLLSTNLNDFGRTLASFQPSSSLSHTGKALEQTEIQHFATSAAQDTTAVITKSTLFIYPLRSAVSDKDSTDGLVIEPTEALDISGMADSEFMSLRQICFMGDGNLAMCMNRSTDPVRFVANTPAGATVVNAAKMLPSERCTESLLYDDDANHLRNARGLLPVNMASVPGGSGSAVLSSYDDGTVRLQDVRTPSAFDAIYQDHFEMVAPMGPLVAHGMDRFIAGSSRASVLKVFDFRWTRGYCYTEALPCSERPLEPRPKSLTDGLPPRVSKEGKCCHLSGQACALHALARTDFYRPNFNAYLPVLERTAGPVYSLAKPSDLSPVVYAGLTRGLVKMSLRDAVSDAVESTLAHGIDPGSRCGYSYWEDLSSLVETGDGIGLADISKSKRLPALYKQKKDKLSATDICKLYRLDESLL